MKHDYKIIVDSREQKPLFTKNIIKKGLKTGDYSFQINKVDYDDVFVVERKSCVDLAQSLNKGHTRFAKELTRAQNIKHFFIIVEESYYALRTMTYKGAEYLNKKSLSYTISKTRKIIQTLRIKYGIQIIFCDSRTESRLVIKELIEAYIRLNGKKNKNG